MVRKIFYGVWCDVKKNKKKNSSHHILHPQQSTPPPTLSPRHCPPRAHLNYPKITTTTMADLSSKSTAHLKPTPPPPSSPLQPTRTTIPLPKNHNKAPHHRVQKTHKSQQPPQQKPSSSMFKNPQAMNNPTHHNRPPDLRSETKGGVRVFHVRLKKGGGGLPCEIEEGESKSREGGSDVWLPSCDWEQEQRGRFC